MPGLVARRRSSIMFAAIRASRIAIGTADGSDQWNESGVHVHTTVLAKVG
jgi:hypothetical protein